MKEVKARRQLLCRWILFTFPFGLGGLLGLRYLKVPVGLSVVALGGGSLCTLRTCACACMAADLESGPMDVGVISTYLPTIYNTNNSAFDMETDR